VHVYVLALIEVLACDIYALSCQKLGTHKNMLTQRLIIESVEAHPELSQIYRISPQYKSRSEISKNELIQFISKTSNSILTPDLFKSYESEFIEMRNAIPCDLPQDLRQLLTTCNGEPKLGFNSCREIKENFVYEANTNLYRFLGWIPIFKLAPRQLHCIDIEKTYIVKVDINNLKDFRNFPILGNNVLEYMNNFSISTQTNLTLAQVDPTLTELLDIFVMNYINQK